MMTSSIILTSYDHEKIKSAISKITRASKKLGVEVGSPIALSNRISKDQPKLWGCLDSDLKIKKITVKGSFQNIKETVKTKTPNGVLVELVRR